ncbi:MAG TPA: hypothetical protein PKE45_06075, partial [Caldilineaceae bacterium]|nr:hypothetical protein [Caldilineaceae bacterium]
MTGTAIGSGQSVPTNSSVYPQLPTHPVPRRASRLAANPQLRIEGLVAHECAITPSDLAHLSRVSFTEDFHCEQHWT